MAGKDAGGLTTIVIRTYVHGAPSQETEDLEDGGGKLVLGGWRASLTKYTYILYTYISLPPLPH